MSGSSGGGKTTTLRLIAGYGDVRTAKSMSAERVGPPRQRPCPGGTAEAMILPEHTRCGEYDGRRKHRLCLRLRKLDAPPLQRTRAIIATTKLEPIARAIRGELFFFPRRPAEERGARARVIVEPETLLLGRALSNLDGQSGEGDCGSRFAGCNDE